MTTTNIAIVFPGQGSQSIGMLSELAAKFPSVQATYAKASSVLAYDLWQMTQQGSAAELDQTEITQPALLAAGYATWEIVQRETRLGPCLFAGHSLGEYTALAAANALEFSAAIDLVATRGRLMQAAVPKGQGAMAAIIGLDDAKVREICTQAAASDVLAPANFNSPGQVVIAGHQAAIQRAVKLADAAGARLTKILAVSGPFHSELMRTAALQLAEKLKTVNVTTPVLPVINNVDVCHYTQAEKIKDALVRQVYKPVRWVETIEYMRQMGIDALIECGPERVLAGLTKRIDRSIKAFPVYDLATLEKLKAHLASHCAAEN